MLLNIYHKLNITGELFFLSGNKFHSGERDGSQICRVKSIIFVSEPPCYGESDEMFMR